jgi:hypothetical protein
MVEQILLNSDSFAGVRETGGFGQPLHALHPQIRALLASELGPEAAGLLAEPVVDRTHNRIDWYTEGDPARPPTVLSDLPEEQRQPILARVRDLLERGREVAERYAASGDPRRVQLGAVLRAALNVPAETEVFLVEERPVMIRWGFMPDRPWEALADSSPGATGVPFAAEPAEPPRDVVMPEIAMPELELAAAPESPAGMAPEIEPPPVPASVSAPSPPSPAPASAVPPQPPAELSAPAPAPAAAGFEPPAKSEPESRLYYVVVGSRYFWSVFALAVLLAVSVAVWRGMGKPSLDPLAGETPPSLASDADLDRALAEAQRTETELRNRLEDLLVQLAERRGQCALPVAGTDAATAAPVLETGGSREIPVRPNIAVAGGESPREPAVTAPAPATDRAAGSPGGAPAADRASGLPGEAPVADRAPGSAIALAPPPSAASFPDKAGPLPAGPESPQPAGMESPARTLEDVLTGRVPAVTAPVRQPPSSRVEPPVEAGPEPVRTEPPVKAEPTAEERREFTSRLAAAGAATGEITATLLWNSSGDLDLVVRCPSGQQLDYRHPSACGGALDVDANAARASLSDRPVENAFWPAGRAAPGHYEIVVRYAPRKDEQNPRETPFQVRLIRGGQESVFKGAIRPNAMVSVTTFTVER